MRIKLTLLTLLCIAMTALADTGVKGIVVDSRTGKPVADANVLLRERAIFVVTGSDGVFTISNTSPGEDVIDIIVSGYEDASQDVVLKENIVLNIGEIKVKAVGGEIRADKDDLIFNEEELAEDEGIGQQVSTISGATDDIYYQAANYNFSTVRFRMRGYDTNWQTGYVNGVNMNDAMRGLFNYSMFGGMTSGAFRNRSTEIGQSAASYGYGSIGGSSNVTTYASEYAPGWKGNLSYTNSNYMLRAMLQYASGLNKHGWAFSASVIGRYAPEGVIEGTFYNSIGYFFAVQKVFNDKHSLNLSTWGAPTQRASNAAATQETYDLAGSNLYNPSWGYLNGKKKSSRVIEAFDPSVMLNWLWTPKMGTKLNTALAFRSNNYSSSALNWYQAADPRPDYYRYLPSYYAPTVTEEEDPDLYAQQLAQQEFVRDAWQNDPSIRQINWDQLYLTNHLNCQQYDRDPSLVGQSTYILEDRHSNFNAYMLNSNLDHRLNDYMTLQAGLNVTYTDAHYYKTIRDLLGGEYWRDIDNFSERDFAGDVNIMQNDLDNPNRKVYKGDIFGYNYYIRNIGSRLWAQNQIVTKHWNVNYAAEVSTTNFWREGMMRNGRAPYDEETKGIGKPQSLGTGNMHSFVNFGVKAAATYKLDGRNFFTAHVGYGSRAPLPNDAYISPRTKDTSVGVLKSEKYLAADLSYTWNYKNFRGSVKGYYTYIWDAMKRSGFYDYDLNSFMNYAMSGMQLEYKGIELGLQYKILSNLSVSAAGSIGDYRYKNNPWGVRSYENGSEADVVRKVYLKNYHIGGTPQQAVSFAINYNIKRWFFEVNTQWMGDGYFELSPSRHEEMPGLWKFCSSEEDYKQRMEEITHQDKLNNEWVMNLSIGKLIYTKFGQININLSVNNLLNNRNIQTGGWQEGKFDYTNYDVNKFPNKVYYAQGIRVYLNLGIRF